MVGPNALARSVSQPQLVQILLLLQPLSKTKTISRNNLNSSSSSSILVTTLVMEEDRPTPLAK